MTRLSPMRHTDVLFGFDAGRAVGEMEGYTRGHRLGYSSGYREGRTEEQADHRAAEDAAREAICRDVAARAAGWVPADELADRRGDHDRAEELRRLFAARAIRAPHAQPTPGTPPIDVPSLEQCLASWDTAVTSAA